MRDAAEAYSWLWQWSPEGAERWYDGLMLAIRSLEQFPERCPLAPESEELGHEVRQHLHGRRRLVHRVLFVIQSGVGLEEKVVRVLRIWHGSRDQISRAEIEEGLND